MYCDPEEIAEVFADAGKSGECYWRRRWADYGFHVTRISDFRVRGPKTAAQKRADSQATLARRDGEYRARLLAGERPKNNRRPATRWVRIAKELGIDLTQAAPSSPAKP